MPGQPSSLSTKSLSSTKIVISWSAPTDEGDGITGYSVKWQAAGESKIYQKEVTGSRTVTLDKLTPYTLYEIHVRAESLNGDGLWSGPLKVRTNESSELLNYTSKCKIISITRFTQVTQPFDPKEG